MFLSLFVNKLCSIFGKKVPTVVLSVPNTSAPITHKETQIVDLNTSPANINRPKINNLSSKLLLKAKGKAFVPKTRNDCTHYTSVRDLTPANVFLDENHKFKPEYNAKELSVLDEEIGEVFSVDNLYYPHGSIALTKDFDDTIITSNLWQCAALSIVNKKENIQTLLHFCPTMLKKYNDELLDYLLKFGDPENLEFTIVPGCFDDTDNTMAVLYDKIKEKIPNANINFKFFPKDSDEVLVLKNGNLFSTEYSNILSKVVNPMEDICYATIPNEI